MDGDKAPTVGKRATESEDVAELQMLFDNYAEEEDEILEQEYVDLIVDSMRRNPRLATKRFEATEYDKPVLPLWILVSLAANVDSIKQVYELYPDALTDTRGAGCASLLHVACYVEDSLATILFIAEKSPQRDWSIQREEPISIFLDTYSESWTDPETFLTLQKLIELCPGSIHSSSCRSPLHCAFKHSMPLEVIQYVFERADPAMSDLVVQDLHGRTWTEDQVTAISILLPQLKSFSFRMENTPVDVSLQLFQSLADNSSKLQELSIGLPWIFLKIDATPILNAPMSNLIESAHSLRRLCFEGYRIMDRVNMQLMMDSLLVILGNCLPMNPNLEELELTWFTLSDCVRLSRFVSSRSPPPKLHLTNLSIEGSWASSPAEEACQLEDIVIRGRNSSLDWIPDLLYQLSPLETLNHLSVEAMDAASARKVDITDPLLAVLHQARLLCLTIVAFHIDIVKISQCLLANRSLTFLNISNASYKHKELSSLAKVLDQYNTTLEDVHLAPRGHWTAELDAIYFFTNLNKLGRRIATDPNTSLAHFIQLLCNANDINTFNSFTKDDFLYGLLRSAPELWSRCSSY
jgi:hypothetical protein